MDRPVQSPVSQQTSAASSVRSSPSSKIIPPAPVDVKAPSTDTFLKDYTLVAEAAKRAQMAVMMRDFETVGI